MSHRVELSDALGALAEIDKKKEKPLMLVGGIAVNQYHPARTSSDIDLICTYNEAIEIADMYDTAQWSITDNDSDPIRPCIILKQLSKPYISINFGFKITEREGYEFLDWKSISEGARPLLFQGKKLKNILVPTCAGIAYSKLISYLSTDRSEEKRGQDLLDFINVSNHRTFSLRDFYSMADTNGAIDYIKSGFGSLSDKTVAIDRNSILNNVVDLLYSDQSNSRAQSEKVTKNSAIGADLAKTIVDAALYFRDATIFADDEIEASITQDATIPYSLLYKTELGSKAWLRLCGERDYAFYHTSYDNLRKRVDSMVAAICKSAGRKDFDLISLGVGDGKKDELLVNSFLSQCGPDDELYYYPMDVNLSMIQTTAKQISDSRSVRTNINKLSIKPFVGDFIGIDQMDLFYNYRKSPNVFSVLGNTIGNAIEDKLLTTLNLAVKNDDYVIFEVNTSRDVNEAKNLQQSDSSVDHDLSPLRTLQRKLEFDSSDLRYEMIEANEVNQYTRVNGTVTSLAICPVKIVPSGRKKDVKLSIVHYYDFENFIEYVKSLLKMEVVFKFQDNSQKVGILVLKRIAD